MTFSTQSGTRGPRRRQTADPITRTVMKALHALHRTRRGRFMGMNVLFLTTTGAKSGQKRTTALAWIPDGQDAWLIAAAARGSALSPAWYHNMAAHTDQVMIQFPATGRTLRVVPEQLEGERRETAWQRMVAQQPRYTGYQSKTDRKIPVIRLTRAPG